MKGEHKIQKKCQFYMKSEHKIQKKMPVLYEK